MEFRISDTFTDSLSKLSVQEQKAVKMTAFDLQLDSAKPGMRFHRVESSKDQNFWSVRANADVRLIIHKTASSFLLCYAGHHDDAYRWAERRKIERHPRTGAAQLVEVRETVEEVVVKRPAMAEAEPAAKPLLFADVSDDDLLRYGVPQDWLPDVKRADEDSLFVVAERLPQEAAEALLDLATGGTPAPPEVISDAADAFAHPDAQRRFRVLSNVEELERALEYPWEKWTVFLHPAQRQYAEREYSGPARIAGSAGTGKTVVALHRAAFLARKHGNAKVLLTTFSRTLANALRVKLERLTGNEPEVHSRIKVRPIFDIGQEMHATLLGEPRVASELEITHALMAAKGDLGDSSFSDQFLASEWSEVVDAWRLETWEAYRDVARLGRKARIGGKQRERLWAIFQKVHNALQERGLLTPAQMFTNVAQKISMAWPSPFEFVVVDEAQDMGVPQLRFLSALGCGQSDALFFAGDQGQRIFQLPFSWKAIGVDIRGRSNILQINYRTSHQIRSQADLLLPSVLTDVDGNEETRRGTQSVLNGPPPEIDILDDQDKEIERVAQWLRARDAEGIQPHEIGVFVRTRKELTRARAAVEAAGHAIVELTDSMQVGRDEVAIGTMHLAKGLEFKAVAVMACDDEIIPLQSRIEGVSDISDLDDVYATERHLLYVACTRARDRLLITGVDPASEFLDDMH